MLNGRPPYKALLTHGFAVDGEGRKMSKSKGNGVEPQKVSSTLGAEILRLWVASTDYSGELFISDEILKRVVEGYRRIRNTLRFLLANTSDFDAAKDAVPLGELLEIDRYALAAARALADAAEGDYARYEFHVVVQRLQTFCSEDLGGFYLDVLKDRLYTTGKASVARRSAQTALALIRDALLLLMAPVLSFTAEEAWRIVRPGEASIFCRTWVDALPRLPDAEALMAKWSRILAVRAAVLKELETLRQGGKIGSSLQAEVAIGAPDADYDALASLGDDLRFVLITSAATRRARGTPRRSTSKPSAHAKCERCWHYRPDVGADAAHPTLCGRCVVEPVRLGRASRLRVTRTTMAALAKQTRIRSAGCGSRPAVIVADQLTKAAVVAALREGGGIAVTPFFTLVLTYNTGAAFSFLASASGWQRWFFAGDRLRRGDRHRGAVAARRNPAVQCRPGADPRRRARQSHRSPGARQSGRLPALSLCRVGVSRVQRRGQRDHDRRRAAHPRQLPPASRRRPAEAAKGV